MHQIDVLTIISDILFTWGVGLLPPFLIRYVFYRRQIKEYMAVIVCATFLVFNLIFFISLGSQSKTHAVLFLIAIVSYKILRIEPKRKDLVTINTEPCEPHSGGLRWYKRLVFQLKWRFFVSVIISMVVIGGGVLISAHMQTMDENERYAALTIEEKVNCAQLEPEYRYSFLNCEHGQYVRHVQEAIPDVFFIFPAFTVGLFALISAISLYYSEYDIGWRRLAIVIAILFTTASIITLLAIEEDFEFSFSSLAILLIQSFAAFPIGILLILGGRLTYLWVRSGFESTSDHSNDT